MKRNKPYYFWYRSTIKMNIWTILMYILVLSIFENLEPDRQHCASSQITHIVQPDFGSAVLYHHIVKLSISNETFANLNIKFVKMLSQVYYACEYLKARKSHHLLKRLEFYKIFEFSDQLYILMFWKTVLSTARFEMSNIFLKLTIGTIYITITTLFAAFTLIKDVQMDFVSTWNKRNLLHTMLFIIECINLEFYLLPMFLGPSVADFIFTIIVTSWFISRKTRNKLMHILNGNVSKKKTTSTFGNVRTTRTNSSRNSESLLKFIPKTSN
eukprot:260271_1